jgi:hypothetical protein
MSTLKTLAATSLAVSSQLVPFEKSLPYMTEPVPTVSAGQKLQFE